MGKIIFILVSSFVFSFSFSVNAFASKSCLMLSNSQADTAKILMDRAYYRVFDYSGGELVGSELRLTKNVEVALANYEMREFNVLIDGERVDLSTVYLRTHEERFVNVGAVVGCDYRRYPTMVDTGL